MKRAILDTNVLISYLLAPDRQTAVQSCVDSAIAGVYRVVLPEPLVQEFSAKLASKPSLATRISPEMAERFIALLTAIGELTERFGEPIPAVSRDAKDNYLLTYGRIADVDYLVTGDKDMLVVRDLIARPAIRTPAEFVQELGIDMDDIDVREHASPRVPGSPALSVKPSSGGKQSRRQPQPVVGRGVVSPGLRKSQEVLARRET